MYTRNLQRRDRAVPEIVEAVQRAAGARADPRRRSDRAAAGGAPQPFQVTMRRFGRKLDVARMRAELPLAVFFFDCLHRDGDDADRSAGHERFDALVDALPGALRDPAPRHADVAAAEDFYADALARGHEGVMVKALDAPYEAGARRKLAQGQARAHARPGRARRRMGPRPAQRLALEPAPRRARSGAAGSSCSARRSRA